MKTQKFRLGDLVRVAKDLGSSRSHFTSDCDAIVVGSYADQFGGSDVESYTLMLLPEGGRCSWYYEEELTLIEKGFAHTILDVAEKKLREESSLVWIKNNWTEFKKEPNSIGLQKLASFLGCYGLWGPQGEGITYYANACAIISFYDKNIIPHLKGENEEDIARKIQEVFLEVCVCVRNE